MRYLDVNRQGVRDVVRSEPVRRMLERKATAVASAAGPGMAVDSQIGRNRARASVRTHTRRAMRGEAKDRRLTRALGAARRG